MAQLVNALAILHRDSPLVNVDELLGYGSNGIPWEAPISEQLAAAGIVDGKIVSFADFKFHTFVLNATFSKVGETESFPVQVAPLLIAHRCHPPTVMMNAGELCQQCLFRNFVYRISIADDFSVHMQEVSQAEADEYRAARDAAQKNVLPLTAEEEKFFADKERQINEALQREFGDEWSLV
jgi:hypothetical protein